MRKNKNEEQITKKSRAKYQCPIELENMIEHLNLIPFNVEMEAFEHYREYNPEVLPLFRECFHKLPEDFQKHTRRIAQDKAEDYAQKGKKGIEEISGYKLGIATGFYRAFYDLRKAVMEFIDRTNRMRQGEEFDEFSDPLRITTTINLTKTDETFEASLTGFASLIGHFQPDRLRICEICSRLFWAKRKESKTCSARCFNNFRQNLYRKLTVEEKAERKARREANKLRNKTLKEIKENKNNGTL